MKSHDFVRHYLFTANGCDQWLTSKAGRHWLSFTLMWHGVG